MSHPNPTVPRTRSRGPVNTPGRSVHPVALVAVLIMGVLSYQLNSGMLSPALPDMAKTLGVSSTDIGQVSSLFFLAGAVSGIVLARWSDFIGRRRALIIVLIVLAAGTLLCIFAPNLPVLLIGRVLQGASSAAFQLTYVILNEQMTPKRFGMTLGIITAVNGGIGGVDGYIGGLLADGFGYRSIFVVIFIFGLIGLVGVALVVPSGRPSEVEGKMDWAGGGALSIGLICATYFVSQGSSAGWLAPSTLLFLAGTVVFFVAFWWIEKRRSTPLIAVHHLRSRQVWPVIATTILTLSGIFAVINFSVVLLSQGHAPGFGMSAAGSALLYLMPPALIGVAAAPLAGWIAGKRGWILMLRVGLFVSLLVVAAIATFAFDQWIVFALVAVLGITYNGLVLTTSNGLGVLLSPSEAPAALPGLNGAAFGIGASLGIGIVAPFIGQATAAGYTAGLWISAGITLGALITSLFILPRADHKL
jgi:Arabinose efflux permease